MSWAVGNGTLTVLLTCVQGHFVDNQVASGNNEYNNLDKVRSSDQVVVSNLAFRAATGVLCRCTLLLFMGSAHRT